MRCEHYQAKGVVRTSVDLWKPNLPQFHHNLSQIIKKSNERVISVKNEHHL